MKAVAFLKFIFHIFFLSHLKVALSWVHQRNTHTLCISGSSSFSHVTYVERLFVDFRFCVCFSSNMLGVVFMGRISLSLHTVAVHVVRILLLDAALKASY